MQKQWYEIHGRGPAATESEILAKVKTYGLALLIAVFLKTKYSDVTVI